MTKVALWSGTGVVGGERDVVIAEGPDTLTFLQGQLSQDVAGLAVGASAWTLLLQPQGKVDAWMRVTRTGEDTVIADLDAGFGPAALARLNRFKLRTRCELRLARWSWLALRGSGWANGGTATPLAPLPGRDAGGPGAAPAYATAHGAGRAAELAAETGAVIVAPVSWPGVGGEGFDLLGPELSLPAGAELCDASDLEALRIESGVAAMGRELDDHTIPAEAGEWLIAQSVSFTKGCYTGQELVARVDSRGNNTPRRLRALVLEGEAQPPLGAEVRVGGAAVGRLSSVAWSPARGAVVGLAMVGRAVEPPAQATVCWDGGEAAATIGAVPLG